MQKITLAIGFAILGLLPTAQSENLLQVYHQALHFNPNYASAKTNSQIAQDAIHIARAELLPQINATTQTEYQFNATNNSSVPWNSNHNSSFGLSINQTLFDFSKFNSLDSAKTSALAEHLKTLAEQQNLMTETAHAYFEVALAQKILTLNKNKKKDQYQLYQQALKEFKAGQVTHTNVIDAQAAYIATTARLLSLQNDLNKKISALQEITGVHLKRVSEIQPDRFTIITPNHLASWIEKARFQNVAVRSSQYALQAAQYNIKAQQAKYLPTLEATGNYNSQYNFPNNGGQATNVNGMTVGLSLNFPIYSGGITNAQTKQARHQYEVLYQALRKEMEYACNQIRQSYSTLITDQSLLKSLKKSISLQSEALRETQISYTAGFQNMRDLLQAQDQLYSQQEQYFQEVYAYLTTLFSFKQAAGVLQEKDIVEINGWLE